MGLVITLFILVTIFSLWPKVRDRYSVPTEQPSESLSYQKSESMGTVVVTSPNSSMSGGGQVVEPEKPLGLQITMPDYWDPAQTNVQLAYQMGKSEPIVKLPNFMPMITSSNALMGYALGMAKMVRVIGQDGSTNLFPFDVEEGMPSLVKTIQSVSTMNGTISVVDDDGDVVMVTSPNSGGLDLGLPEIMKLKVEDYDMSEYVATSGDSKVKRDLIKMEKKNKVPFHLKNVGQPDAIFIVHTYRTVRPYKLSDGMVFGYDESELIPPLLRRRQGMK